MKDVKPIERRPLINSEDVDTIVKGFAERGLRIQPDHAEAVWLLYSKTQGQLWATVILPHVNLVELLSPFYFIDPS